MLHSLPRVAEALAEAQATELFFNEGQVKKNKTWGGESRVDTTLDLPNERNTRSGAIPKKGNRGSLSIKTLLYGAHIVTTHDLRELILELFQELKTMLGNSPGPLKRYLKSYEVMAQQEIGPGTLHKL